MAGVRIRFEGGPELQEALRRAAQRTTHLRPAWKQAGEIMLRSIDETFHVEGRPEPWQPLSPATVFGRLGGGKAFIHKGKRQGEMKAHALKKLATLKILQQSGQLLDSVIYQAENSYLELGSVKVYAAIHQYGGAAGRVDARVQIPARPCIVVLPEDERAITEVLDHYIVTGEVG